MPLASSPTTFFRSSVLIPCCFITRRERLTSTSELLAELPSRVILFLPGEKPIDGDCDERSGVAALPPPRDSEDPPLDPTPAANPSALQRSQKWIFGGLSPPESSSSSSAAEALSGYAHRRCSHTRHPLPSQLIQHLPSFESLLPQRHRTDWLSSLPASLSVSTRQLSSSPERARSTADSRALPPPPCGPPLSPDRVAILVSSAAREQTGCPSSPLRSCISDSPRSWGSARAPVIPVLRSLQAALPFPRLAFRDPGLLLLSLPSLTLPSLVEAHPPLSLSRRAGGRVAEDIFPGGSAGPVDLEWPAAAPCPGDTRRLRGLFLKLVEPAETPSLAVLPRFRTLLFGVHLLVAARSASLALTLALFFSQCLLLPLSMLLLRQLSQSEDGSFARGLFRRLRRLPAVPSQLPGNVVTDGCEQLAPLILALPFPDKRRCRADRGKWQVQHRSGLAVFTGVPMNSVGPSPRLYVAFFTYPQNNATQ